MEVSALYAMVNGFFGNALAEIRLDHARAEVHQPFYFVRVPFDCRWKGTCLYWMCGKNTGIIDRYGNFPGGDAYTQACIAAAYYHEIPNHIKEFCDRRLGMTTIRTVVKRFEEKYG